LEGKWSVIRSELSRHPDVKKQFYRTGAKIVLNNIALFVLPHWEKLKQRQQELHAAALDILIGAGRIAVPLPDLANQLSPALIKKEFVQEARTLSYQNVADAIDVRLKPPKRQSESGLVKMVFEIKG
jgi:hypothetical protein